MVLRIFGLGVTWGHCREASTKASGGWDAVCVGRVCRHRTGLIGKEKALEGSNALGVEWNICEVEGESGRRGRSKSCHLVGLG